MQNISLYTPNNVKYNNRVSFTGGVEKTAEVIEEFLDARSVRLIKKAYDVINDTWTDIQKGKTKLRYPEFKLVGRRGTNAIVRPLYNNEDYLLVDVNRMNHTDRYIIKRRDPQKFRYEKVVPTQYGSVTVSSYDSARGKNQQIIDKINDDLQSFLPKMKNKKSSHIERYFSY